MFGKQSTAQLPHSQYSSQYKTFTFRINPEPLLTEGGISVYSIKDKGFFQGWQGAVWIARSLLTRWG